MQHAKPKARLYVSARLGEGAAVEPDRGQAHYLVQVMRIGAGDRIALFNGRDGEWLAEATAAGKKKVTLEVRTQSRPQTDERAPDVWLAFAPVKKARTDFIVEKATELGAARLLPVLTERSETKRVNAERLQALATEAAEQCRRLSVPGIAQAQTLERLCESWPAARPLFVLDETGSGEPLGKALTGLKGAITPPCGFLIGPEGGFAARELDALGKLPFAVPVSLGPRILRAETAAVAALAAFQTTFEV